MNFNEEQSDAPRIKEYTKTSTKRLEEKLQFNCPYGQCSLVIELRYQKYSADIYTDITRFCGECKHSRRQEIYNWIDSRKKLQ